MTEQDKLMFRAGYVRATFAAKAMALSERTIRRRIESKEIGGQKSGHNWYVLLSDLTKVINDVQREALITAVRPLAAECFELDAR